MAQYLVQLAYTPEAWAAQTGKPPKVGLTWFVR